MHRSLRARRAQGIAEYALIILFIVLVAAVGIVVFGKDLGNLFNSIGGAFSKCTVSKIGTTQAGC